MATSKIQQRKPGEHPVSWGTDKIVTKSGALGCQPDKHNIKEQSKIKRLGFCISALMFVVSGLILVFAPPEREKVAYAIGDRSDHNGDRSGWFYNGQIENARTQLQPNATANLH